MSDLKSIFTGLGLELYLDAFITEGFDTWETVLDIQEGDLDALNVKLGHRRKLQREIATQRSLYFDRSIGSPSVEHSVELGRAREHESNPSHRHERSGTEKRKYRRHPKPDTNAPEKPSSAYVLFSNEVREQVRDQNLSFTDIAKLVGDRWQKLDVEGKEPFERSANTAKEHYHTQLAIYKKTESYKEYTKYHSDFKAKHGGQGSEGKRPRLGSDSRRDTVSTRTTESTRTTDVSEARSIASPLHGRDLSIGSINTGSCGGILPSPNNGNFASTLSGPGTSNIPVISSPPPPTTLGNSPPSRVHQQDLWTMPMATGHRTSSFSSQNPRQDFPDIQPSAGLPSLAHHHNYNKGLALPEPSAPKRAGFPFSPSSVYPDQSSAISVAPSDSSAGSNIAPVTPADEPWRHHPPDKMKGLEWQHPFGRPVMQMSTSNYVPPTHCRTSLERTSDVRHDLAQRILPLPAPSSPRDVRDHYRGLLNPPTLHSPESLARDLEMSSDNPESDAVKALAGLASRGR